MQYHKKIFVFALSKNKLIQVDLKTFEVQKTLEFYTEICNCFSISPDGLTGIATSSDGTIRIVDIISLKEIGCQLIHECEINDLVSIQQGTYFITTDMKGYVGRFNLKLMRVEQSLNISKYFLKPIAAHPTEFLVAVGGQEPGISILKF